MSIKRPMISIIMPAYNVERYIEEAIKSVLDQTIDNWELVIVSEGDSEDRTNDILQNYTDERIKIIITEEKTGSPYAARIIAFEHSRGEYIVTLDADDYLEKRYLEKLYNRILETDADLCGAQMVVVDAEGVLSKQRENVPSDTFDYGQILSGREAYFNTVPQWKIGLNGCLCKKDVWGRAIKKTLSGERITTNTDEVMGRYICLFSSKVSFAKAAYFYRMNENSLTSTVDWHIFDTMDSRKHLLDLITEDYGKESDECKAIEVLDYDTFHGFFGHFVRASDVFIIEEIMRFLISYKSWHQRINWKVVKETKSIIRFYLTRNFYFYFTIRFLQYKKYRKLISIGEKYLEYRILNIIRNKYERWYFERIQSDRQTKAKVIKTMHIGGDDTRHYPICVVNMFDGRIQAGGLADRLRGILSTYSICRKLRLEYKLYFNSPFMLSDYLEPNRVDWKIERKDICDYCDDCRIVVLGTSDDSEYQRQKQRDYMNKRLRNIDKQTIVYTSAHFVYSDNYSELFHELFRPSKRLKDSIDLQKEAIGNKYISVSCRFMDLLGDFNETYGTGIAISASERNYIVAKCIEQIEELHESHPAHSILVNSDSKTFLSSLKSFNYVYTIPGNITHIDADQAKNNYEEFEKTFLDFFMISEADEVFLFVTGKMFNSGYPYAASLVNNRPYKVIRF